MTDIEPRPAGDDTPVLEGEIVGRPPSLPRQVAGAIQVAARHPHTRAVARNAVYVGVGEDKPQVGDLLPGTTRTKNLFLWASYFHKLTDAVTLAVEWSRWDFQTVTFVSNAPGPLNPLARVNVLNISLAYQF